MKRIIIIKLLLIFSLALIFTEGAFARDRCRIVESKPSRVKNHVAFSGFEFIKVDPKIKGELHQKFTDALEKKKNVAIINAAKQRSILREWDRQVSAAPCKDKECIEKNARRLSADYAVAGTITRVREYRRRKDGYLIYRWYVDTYEIDISLYRAADGEVLSHVENTKVAPKKINDELIKTAELFSRYIKIQKDYKTVCADIRRGFVGGSFEYDLPFGKFRKLTFNGFGLTINGGLQHYFLDNLVLGGEGTFMAFTDNNAAMNQFYAMRMNIYAGYQFELPYNFALMPRIGAGFHLFFIDNVLNQLDIYFDSMMIVSGTLLYHLNDNWSLTFDTGTNVFFEKNNLGNYWFFNFGIRYYL